MTDRSTIASPDEIERLIYHMPACVRMAENEWAQGFAKSIIRQSRRKNWRPSDKQLPVMRELANDLFTNDPNTEQEGDIVLIE